MPPARLPILLTLAALALVALATGGARAEQASCTATPAGFVCTYDTGRDGVPERVYLVDLNGRNALAFDLWHRPGFDALLLSTTNAAAPAGVRTGTQGAQAQAYDRNTDAAPERVDLRVDALLPSNIGGYATVRVTDASSNGLPERVDVFLFTTHAGTRTIAQRTGLP